MKDYTNSKVTLLLPVRSADRQTHRCIRSVLSGSLVPKIIAIVLSPDRNTAEELRKEYPDVTVFDLGMNPGRAHALNTGFHITKTPYAMTLSPGLVVGKHCVERLCGKLDEDGSLFSVQAAILTAGDPSRIRGTGWNFRLDGEPYLLGEGAGARSRRRDEPIAAAMSDAAVYRMEALEITGLFDERFYGKLEDADLGYRALLSGYRNLYVAGAVCREKVPERETLFWQKLETGNRIYLRYKNTPGWQKTLGRPFELMQEFVLEKVLSDAGSGEMSDAKERGRLLCFQAEMELMERTELSMSVTKQTLPEEFVMKVSDERVNKVYPLYLGERTADGIEETAAAVKAQAGMVLAGVRDRLRL